MTNDEELSSIRVIDFCRTFNRRMAEKQAEVGARIEDIAVAAIFSAVDLAQVHTGGDPVSAIEWARTALDVMERDLLLAGTLQ